MNAFSRIWFPVAFMAMTTAGSLGLNRGSVHASRLEQPSEMPDTVVYRKDAYKYKRNLKLEEIIVKDTLNLTDSLALEGSDSVDFVSKPSPKDSLKATLDSTLWDKLDSIWIADSTAKAKAAFAAWYAGLSKKERRAYDMEQKSLRMVAIADSLRKVKEDKQNLRDSIIAEKPRILETFALADSMQYKRIVRWTLDQDFHKMKGVSMPDTSFNYWFNDLPFLRNDVNGSWLGVSGSPVQTYNVMKKKSGEGVDFYDALESWSYSASTLPHYNTKTPYTELAYWGTLFAGNAKESDNLHIFTTQNITPELNISLMFNRFGGNGILNREKTINKTSVIQTNYLGKKYLMHAGFIHNVANREENGGIADIFWIRDTTVDAREIKVNLNNAESKVKKNTFFIDQQLRIPFNFINKIRAKKDTSFVYNADSLDRNITTAFVGHSSELSFYTRKYTDAISDQTGRDFYNNIFYYNPAASADSLRTMKLDNKVFIRLQPWGSSAIVSKLDLGAGDYVKQYFDSTTVRPMRVTHNSFYIYAGAEGQLRNNLFWDAKARYVLLGHDFSDFDVQANALFSFYPFRRARKSPLSLGVHFETSLKEPTYYQQFMSSNHFRWENSFGKVSRTEISADLSIPRWKIYANAGYTLLANNIYYDQYGIIRQNAQAMSVITANLRKDFALGPLHLDNNVLLQFSSDQKVLPVPAVALNLRYYFQFVAARMEGSGKEVLTMQIGIDARANTKWNAPAWNPNLGVFYNQNEREYTNGPYFDVFLNMQWKRACIFVKYQNAGSGWPLRKPDYFSADRYIVTQSGMPGLKLGIYWPFYREPAGRPPLTRN